MVRLRALAEGEQVLGVNKSHGHRLYLRNLAGTVYATNQEGITIEELAKTYPFDVVGVKTIAQWSVQDDWVGRRARFIRSTMRKIEDKIRNHVSEEKVRQLKYVDYLFDKLAHAMDGTPPKSLEGLASAMMKVLEMSTHLRDQVAGQAVEALGGGKEGEEDVHEEVGADGLTDEEVRATALAIAQRRSAPPSEAAGQVEEEEEEDVADE